MIELVLSYDFTSMKTVHGSCHCGAIRYEADLDLGAGTIKCNCSICTKMRFWAVQVPSRAFRLLTGAADLSEYRFHAKRDGHNFCRHCGINIFSTGHSPRLGDFHAITVASLDDVPVEELIAASVRYLDGRNDEWEIPPAETRHL